MTKFPYYALFGIRIFSQALFFFVSAYVFSSGEFANLIVLSIVIGVSMPFLSMGMSQVLLKENSQNPVNSKVNLSLTLSMVVITLPFVFLLDFLAILAISDIGIILFLLVFIEYFVSKMFEIDTHYFQGLNSLKTAVFFQIIFYSVKILLIMTTALLGLNYLNFSFLMAFSSLVLLFYWGVKRYYLINNQSFMNKNVFFIEGLFFAVSTFVRGAYIDSDKLIVKSKLSDFMVSEYSLAYKVINFSIIPTQMLLMSNGREIFKHGRMGLLSIILNLKNVLLLSIGISLFLSAFIYSLSSNFSLTYGEYNISYILKILSPMPFLMSLNYILFDILTGLSLLKQRVLIQVFGLIINVILVLYTIVNNGIYGVALITVLTEVLMLFVTVLYLSIKSRRRGFNG